MENNKGQWSSNFGFLMAAIGSAVGLGNIWGFPYKMGANGGGAFLLVYVILVVFVGFAVMLGELTIGRKTGKGAVGAYRALNKKLPWVGYMGVGSAFLILGFYSVLGGMVMRYMLGFLVNMFGGAGFAAEGFFGSWIANMPGMVGFYALFMLLNIVIVMGGISGGIEKFSKVAMPALAVMLVTVIVYVACQPGAMEGYKFMFVPDFSVFDSLKSFFDVLKSAAGQMFFSLSLGMGAMITYGSYLDRKENIQKNGLLIVVMDSMVAFMAALCVLPARFALDPEGSLGGPSLLFVTMQNVFSRMGTVGPIFGIIFYLLVVFAAISSSISLLEVIVAHFVDKARAEGKGDKRKSYTLIATALVSIGCILVCADALGTSGISPADLLGIENPKTWAADWLDFWDCISEGIMMPLGALLMTFMVAYEIGTEFVKDEIEQCGNKFTMYKFYRFCIRYVTPLGLLLVLYGQIKSFFF